MLLLTPGEAFFVACEMERSAISLYSRGLLLLEGSDDQPLLQGLRDTLKEEKEHLCQFTALYEKEEPLPEDRKLLLSGEAGNLLFEGGLMGAARQGFLESREAMLRFAERSEQISAEQYRAFAALAKDEQAQATLLWIAAEEEKHLCWLMTEGRMNSPEG